MRTTIIIIALCFSSFGRIVAEDKTSDIFGLRLFPSTATNTVPNYVAMPATTPTSHILPENVVQESVQLFRFSTNSFVVRWTYTEAGAKKALSSWEANTNHSTMSAEWKAGWLKHRTDKGFFRS